VADTTFRRARREDLGGILALLADDDLGRGRESLADGDLPDYRAAFEAIDRDPNQLLAVVAEGPDILGCMQITFIPGLARRGAWRGQIEAVRVAPSRRGDGLGARFLAWAVEQCRARGCRLVQLTSDKRRERAHEFYHVQGFEASHVGFKLDLSAPPRPAGPRRSPPAHSEG
jgi:GNAT superfamily N-acetyltransferase